jgi:hypothetical protein
MFLEHLQNAGYDRSYLWTTNELDAAARIYRKMGFQLSTEIDSEAFGKSLKEQRYDLRLKDN